MEEQNYDVLVIGSGIGGLSVAAILAKSGKKVLVLEQHFAPGGFTHAFRRNDYEWDVGLHYVGQVHVEGTLLNAAFRYITDGKLEWAPMDEVYDKAFFGEEIFDFVRGREKQKAKLKQYFPAEEDMASIDKYFALLDEVQNVGTAYYAEKILPPFAGKLAASLLQKKLLHYSDQTTLSVLKSLTDNPKLIGVLTVQYGDYGLPPGQSSFYMHAMVANHYMEGAAYPVGGAGSLARHIVPVIETAGGKVMTKSKVEQILVNGNKAIGVKTEDGQIYTADKVISDTGIENTFKQLLPSEIIQKHQLDTKLLQIKPAVAHVALYIGCNHSARSLGLPKCNYWIFPPEYDHDKNQAAFTGPDAPLPVIFVSFPSAKNPEWETAHPDLCTIEIITLLPYDWFAVWENTSWQNRGEDYINLKEQIAEKLLDKLYQAAPRLKGKIDFYELSTPLSTRTFMNHSRGEIYGIAHTPERFRQNFLRPHTPVKNLFLTGQDIFMASIAGGLMGGILTASAILKRNMFGYIQKTANIADEKK